MEFVERKRSRKSPSFKLVNDAGKQMTADNRRYVSTLECTSLSCSHRHDVASFCSNHSLCLIACVSAAFVVKASLSLCTSSSVMEYSTGLSAAWTWWSSSQSRSLQVVLTRSITSSQLHRTQLTDITTSAGLHLELLRRFRIYYICSSFTLRACICNICAFMNRTVTNTENSSCLVDILLFLCSNLDNSMIFIFPYLFWLKHNCFNCQKSDWCQF